MAGDTVTIPGTASGIMIVNVDVAASCATLTTGYTSDTKYGKLYIGTGTPASPAVTAASLTLTGALTINGTYPTDSSDKCFVNPGGQLLFDRSGNNASTIWTIGVQANGPLHAAGTATNRCKIGAIGTGTGTFGLRGFQATTSSYAYFGFLNCTYTDFVGLGTATWSGISVQGKPSWPGTVTLDNCTFNACGLFYILDNGGQQAISITNCQWINSIDTSRGQSAYLQVALPSSAGGYTGTRILTGNTFDLLLDVANAAWTCNYNVIMNGIVVDSRDLAQWTSFTGNFVRLSAIGLNPCYAYNWTNCYYYYDVSGYQHYHYMQAPNTGATETMVGCIFDCSCGADGVVPVVEEIGHPIIARGDGTHPFIATNCLQLPSPGGYSPGSFMTLGTSTGTYTIEHCTICINIPASFGSVDAGYTGENPAIAGNMASFRGNLVWNSPTSHPGKKFTDWPSDTNPGALLFASAAMCDYNAGWNLVAGSNGKGYDNFTNAAYTAGQLGAHDPADQNPQFVDPTRNLATWWTAGLGNTTTGTYQGDKNAAIAYLSVAGQASTRIPALMAWIQAGFVPRNPALNLTWTGDTNAVANIGAMAGSFAPTTATVSGPASGTVSTESTAFTVTLNLAAPTGGQAVSLASNGTGDVFHAVSGGGSVSSITVAAGQTVGTFYLVPVTTGARTITPTSSGITFTPTTLSYTGNSVLATSYTLTGPASGTVGIASASFTVTPVGGVYTGTITPTSSGSGTFSPSALTFTASSAAQTFVYTPSSTAGSPHQISTTASPALGSSPAAVSYAVNPVPATSYTLTGPSSGIAGTASTNFTVTPVGGVYTGTVTPHATTVAGTFSPSALTFAASSVAQTFTFTPSTTGSGTISTTASPALGTDPTGVAFTANPVSATSYTLTGPSSAVVGTAATFTVTPVGGVYSGTVTIHTSNVSGNLSVTTLTFTASSVAQTFTLTPSAAGVGTVYTNASPALGTDPTALAFTASPPLAAGTVSTSAVTTSTLTVSTTAASGGTSPYTYQFQRAPDSGGSPGTWANIGSSGSSTSFNDTGLSAGTTCWYRVHVTDAASAAINSASASVATGVVYAYDYIDNTDPGCTTTGAWQIITTWPAMTYGVNFLLASSGGFTARYAFTGLTAGTAASVAATWYHDGTMATAVLFTVYDSNGTTVLASGTINQQNAPTDNWTYAGDPHNMPFQVLANVTPSGTSLTFKITSVYGYSIADAASVRQSVPSPATSYTVTAPSPASGNARVASGNFTVTPVGGPFTGTITPQSSSTGSFIPASLTWYGETFTRTFTYTPVLSEGSPHEISTTNTASLTPPSAIGYAVNPFSPLTRQAYWESQMLWASDTGTKPYLVDHAPWLDGSEHYDVIRVFQNIRDYRTANSLAPTNWDDQINAALTLYRDECVLAIGGYEQYHHRYSMGTGKHYYETGNLDSRDAVMLLDDNLGASWWLRCAAWFDGSREVAFALLDVMERERLGQNHQQVTEALACYSLQCIDQWTMAAPRPWGMECQPFMVGITCEALIAYWQRYQGTTDTTALNSAWPGTSSLYNTPAAIVAAIPGKIKAAIDWLWANAWAMNSTWPQGAFSYYWPDPATYQQPIFSTVSAGGATTTTFQGGSTLSSIDNYYQYCYLYFTSGSIAFSAYRIVGYTGSTRTFHIDPTIPLPGSPASGNGFLITPATYTEAIYHASVADSAPTSASFNGASSLSPTNAVYVGCFIVFTSGALATPGNIATVTGYTGATRTLQFSPALSQAPANGDGFVLTIPSGSSAISAPLNPLIGPAYAWYYWYTAEILAAQDTSYRDKHDVIFDGTYVAWNPPYAQKLYSQTYRWSMDGLKWRARGDAEWTAATTYTFTAPSVLTGQANAPSVRFQVALSSGTSVPAPVVLTYHASTGRGTFLPATSVLTTVQPTGLTRFIPDLLDAGTNVTLTVTNSGGLTNPAGIVYTVSGTATIATGRTITGPSAGAVGTPVTLTLQTVPTGSVMPVSWVQAGGGIDVVEVQDTVSNSPFNMPNPGPTQFVWNSSERLSQTFTYTPTRVGAMSLLGFEDKLSLPNIGPISFTVTPPDTTPPVVSSASVNPAGTTLTINFTETGSPPVLPASGATGFTLTASGGAVSLSSPSISGTTYTATLSRTIFSTETLTLAYVPGNITDSATSPNAMVGFTGTHVVNNSTQALPSTATVSGSASGTVSTESTAFTVTLNVAAPSGGTTVNLASNGTGDVFHAISGGGSVSSIAVAAGQAVGTFYLVPGTTGARTITPTSSGITFTPTTLGFTGNPALATSYTLTGPASSVVGTASTAFTVTPVGGVYTGTVTPQTTTVAGTFSPTTLTWSASSAAQTFTFTPSGVATGTISTTASPGLGTNPAAIAFAATPVLATSYTLTGPSSAVVGTAATFTVTPVGGVYSGTVTLHTTNVTGSLSVTSLTFTASSVAQTFTLTPSAAGTGTISSTASHTLGTDPPALPFTATPVLATSYTLTGPSSSVVGTASTSFTVTPVGGVYTGTITPHASSLAGTFSPTSLTWTGTSTAQTFTFTPSVTGSGTIATTSQPALRDPSPVAFVTVTPQSTGYTLTAPNPSSGRVGTVSGAFTVALSPTGSTVPSPVAITPSAGSAGGTFAPASVTLSAGAPIATFTYTPVIMGSVTISCTSSNALSNPPDLAYTSTGGSLKRRIVLSRSYHRPLWGR